MNNNIHYDSFQKFLVSFGFLLMVLPIFIIKFIIFDSSDTLISSTDYNNLSSISLELFKTRISFIKYSYHFIPWICGGLFLIGFVILLFGCKQWKKAQIVKDESDRLDRDLKKLQLERQNDSEIIRNRLSFIYDASENKKSESNDNQQPVKNLDCQENKLDIVSTYMNIANKTCDYIRNKMGINFTYAREVKRDNIYFDFVAISSQKTIFYEIKYWKKTINYSAYHRINKLYQAVASYEGNNEFCLVIVTPTESVKSQLEEDNRNNKHEFKIMIIDEKDLNLN